MLTVDVGHHEHLNNCNDDNTGCGSIPVEYLKIVDPSLQNKKSNICYRQQNQNCPSLDVPSVVKPVFPSLLRFYSKPSMTNYDGIASLFTIFFRLARCFKCGNVTVRC